MLKAARLFYIIIALSPVLAACQSAGTVASQEEREYTAFGVPERVTIRGYGDHAMEPFIKRDGRYLFFNNSNCDLQGCKIAIALNRRRSRR